MARTLSTILKGLEKTYDSLMEGRMEEEEAFAYVEDLITKEDVREIIEELGQILTLDYDAFSEVELRLASPRDLDWDGLPTSYDSKVKEIYFHPFRFYRFVEEANQYGEILDEEDTEDFELYRRNAFIAEMSKLPPKCLLFLCILQQLAASQGLTHIGLTDGPNIAEDVVAYYQTQLWAFCELEKKLYKMNGVDVRTQYGVTWHESEWINLA